MTTLTGSQEISACIASYITPNLSESIVNYYDPVTLTLKTPTNGDYIIEFIMNIILGTIDSPDRDFGRQLSAADKKSLYTSIARQLNDGITDLTAVYTAINTYAVSLP